MAGGKVAGCHIRKVAGGGGRRRWKAAILGRRQAEVAGGKVAGSHIRKAAAARLRSRHGGV